MTTENAGSAGGADDLDLLVESDAKGTTQAKQEPSETIPEKYAGKSVEDIIKMHQHAERKIGEQSREVSTLRRLADEVIGLKKATTRTTEEPRKPVTVEALLNDPERAIRDAVASSDVAKRLEAAEARNAQLESSITEQSFVGKHKNYASDINDPEFIAWTNKNQLRQALANDAASSNATKFTSATNLWDMWEEYKELGGTKVTDDTTKQTAKKVVNTVKSAPNDAARGKQIYSRAKVMEFRARVHSGDPAAVAKWQDPVFQDNLNKAYAEDRVR